jgi:polyphosphate kinase
MPPAERTNMVTIRNANLITMFKAFTKLDTAIQQKVNEAGAADRSIAEGMKSVKEKLDKVEQAMNEALLEVQAHSDRQYQLLKEELHELENKPCHL